MPAIFLLFFDILISMSIGNFQIYGIILMTKVKALSNIKFEKGE